MTDHETVTVAEASAVIKEATQTISGLLKEIERLQGQRAMLRETLQQIIDHHVIQNRIVNRPIERSTTIRIATEALKATEGE